MTNTLLDRTVIHRKQTVFKSY